MRRKNLSIKIFPEGDGIGETGIDGAMKGSRRSVMFSPSSLVFL